MPIFSMQNHVKRDMFRAASQYLCATYNSETINRRWNATGIGKGAILKTTNRWLKTGPKTKNEYFEPWIVAWAAYDLAQELPNYMEQLQVHLPYASIDLLGSSYSE